MSAPNAGRQSPDPENQSGDQQQAPTASNPNDQGADPSQGSAKDASEEQKSGLSSNPTPALAKHSEETTSKK
ncbi:hypothetical protein B0J11DRAFT_516377 [Dendryphion nanum]|uniref:Uncharacterized protein n=1 Tax=Dendryphion nanum TaxID=256645 RepID=A0A9P9J0V3_9PLEO|nr:hypothetical protein B0J11DRAFT_516377 [Dendryphion nanum]